MVYWSGTGNTEKMAELIAKGARLAGAEVSVINTDAARPGDMSGYDVIALGSPALGDEDIEESEMSPFVTSVIPLLAEKHVALFGSCGWGDGEWLRSWASRLEASSVHTEDCLAVKETPEGAEADRCAEFGKRLAGK
ncbi:flavodoxin [Synergistales bacterium]|nr:flavodoxin [Synergistales bacterium]